MFGTLALSVDDTSEPVPTFDSSHFSDPHEVELIMAVGDVISFNGSLLVIASAAKGDVCIICTTLTNLSLASADSTATMSFGAVILPEPGAFLLTGSGLILLIVVRRRKSTAG